jgi:site-specific DNA-methyltransferase (adenine-specific)
MAERLTQPPAGHIFGGGMKPAPDMLRVTDNLTPIYHSRNALLVQADACALPFGEISDLAVTSPPYGAAVDYDAGGDVDPAKWDAFTATWLAGLYRVTKPSGRLALNVPMDMTIGAPRVGRALLSRPTYYQAVHAALTAGWLYKGTITWDKNSRKKGNRGLGSVNSSARPHVVDPTETIILFSKGEWAPSSARPDDILPAEWQEYSRGPWRFPGLPRRKGGHPAPFPDELARRCIRLFSRVGDTVFDPFVGSGTTVAVAVAEGRIGIGSDRSARYLADAAERVAAAALQVESPDRCTICNGVLVGRRRDAATCSSRCRQAVYRQRRAS